METARALRQDMEMETPVGNVSAIAIHQGDNFWLVNKWPWFGIHQCMCVHIGQASIDLGKIYPVQYNWTEHLRFVAREKLMVEYINEELVLDHWVYGPHHVWTRSESGNIVRMYVPFNLLQVYPSGVCKSTE